MSVSADEFRAALGRWASGVTVVTCGCGSELHGMTVSAFSSVSLEPPLVSVCLASGARALEMIEASGDFCVNVLSSDQSALSNHFASNATKFERFVDVDYTLGRNGLPLLAGALAHLECRVTALHAAGDHTLVVGAVSSSAVFDRQPLVYFAGGYGALAV